MAAAWLAAAAAAAAPWQRRLAAAGAPAWLGLGGLARAYHSQQQQQQQQQDDGMDALLQEYEPGHEPPQVVSFEVGEEEARRRFQAWQSGRTRLGPGGLLQPGGPWRMRPALLPFWLFDVTARVEYAGSVGTPDKSSGTTAWRDSGWRQLPERQYSWQEEPALRVYASYRYRRDYAGVANSTWALNRLQPLPLEDARRGRHESRLLGAAEPLAADLHPPALRQEIAWELVLRDLREAEERAAEARLLSSMCGQSARDVRARLHVSSRSARLAFLPAFHLEYQHGEAFNAHDERIPARYEAIIGGTGEGGVAGTRKYSAHRAGGGLLVAGVAATAAAAPLLGLDPWSLASIETGFILATSASLAGLGARMLPVWMLAAEEGRRLRAADAEFERVVDMGVGPLDPGTEEQELLRSAAEWRRWEHVSADDPWREQQRRAWAEDLLQSQLRRRQEREQLRERLSFERARQEEEERREERRRKRWGHSSHHHHFPGQREEAFSGGVRGGGRSDFLGYYQVLGLDAAAARGHVSGEEVKRAFRRAALRWHPDKQDAGDETARAAARERFHRIRAAYETLRDPERRRAYDRGEAVDM